MVEMFACKCLNILIHTENKDLQKVEMDSLKLSIEEMNDPFFKKEIGTVTLGNINKEQAALVSTRNVGLWIIHSCLNCNLDTHAIHRDKGASFVLVATNLLSGSANIAAIRKGESYSAAFRVLINPKFVEEQLNESTPTSIASQLPPNVQLALNSLQQKLLEIVKVEVTATEERIRKYSEMQYMALESFREQVHREHHALVRLVLNSQPNTEEPMKVDHPDAMPPKAELAEAISVEEKEVLKPSVVKPKHPIVTSLSSKFKRSTSRQLSQPAMRTDSIDAEGLFFLEGMESIPASAPSDVEESDTDDSTSHDEGIHIPRQRAQSMSIAKSLPMNIPVFMSTFTHDVQDNKRDFKHAKEDSVDIAASIRALAKSVHGDAVFGDLPRPRFSTQI